MDSWWEADVSHRELSAMLCDDLDKGGWQVEGRLKRKGIHVYIELIHIVVQEKLTQHCKAIMLQ